MSLETELLLEISKLSKTSGSLNIKTLFPILKQIPAERFIVPQETDIKINLKSLNDAKSKKRIIVKEGNEFTTKFVSPLHTKLKSVQSNILTPSTRADDA